MRVWGWVLLIGGFLLCASIVWAAIGFLLMGLGLIFLQIAEDKRKRPAKLAASRPEKSDVRREPPLQELFQALPARIRMSLSLSAVSARLSPDEERWRLQLSNDADIARLATVLASYGQKYVDELAAAYLVLNDKEYLPMICRK